jgi:hypothetical protein
MNSSSTIPQSPPDPNIVPKKSSPQRRSRSAGGRRRSISSSVVRLTITERIAMYDEMARLRENGALQTLLNHYREIGLPDRSTWQDRLCELDGVEFAELARLHGVLIAFGWLEQNTGVVTVLQRGGAPACYRITTAGLRALKILATEEVAEV